MKMSAYHPFRLYAGILVRGKKRRRAEVDKKQEAGVDKKQERR